MLNRLNEHSIEPQKPARAFTVYRLIVCIAVLIGSGLRPPTIHGQEINADTAPLPPLLVKALPGDTPARIAKRYLHDASKGWMIVEYNGMETISGGETILIPRAPFRAGGLTPDGFQNVPVLVYSDVGSDIGPDSDDASGPKPQVSRSAFSDQMRWLKTEGFTAITPAELAAFMDFSGQLPQRAILITMDTQSQSFHDLGVPILKALGFTATVFVATEGVGREGTMTWDQIEQLHQDGFTIACRGQSGRSLTRRTEGEGFQAYFESMESELRLAKIAIETRLGAPCLFLAYPHGTTSSLVSAMAAKLGFSAAFTLSAGDNPFFADRFGIHRIAIDGHINPEQFGSMLTTMITADLN